MNDWAISFLGSSQHQFFYPYSRFSGANASTSISINISSSPNLGTLNDVQTGRCPGILSLIFGTKYFMASSMPTA